MFCLYPTPDKEKLCIQEILEEFRDILYGAVINIKTDHKNLVSDNLKSNRLLNWRLLIDEFNPTIEYIPGPDNVLADELSRHPILEIDPSKEEQTVHESLAATMLYYPSEVDQFPLTLQNIRAAQEDDLFIASLRQAGTYQYFDINGTQLTVFMKNDDPKIVVPESLWDTTLTWYHLVLGHIGISRMISSISNHLFIPGLKAKVEELVASCDSCQRNKHPGPGYGEVPPRDDVSVPWEEIAVDCIGPWRIPVAPFGDLTFKALTVVDTCTTLLEIVRVDDNSAQHAAHKLGLCWLSRYPRPSRCIFDQGTEFKSDFLAALDAEGIKPVPITTKNPQANAIIERTHKTAGDMIRTYVRESPPTTVAQAIELIDEVLASVQRAMRASTHSTMKISPGALVFGRDMLLAIPVAADLENIRAGRQTLIDRQAARENSRRRFKDYAIGDPVLILNKLAKKMEPRAHGPYTVTQVHANGTVSIERRAGTIERINIRRIRPYRFPSDYTTPS